MDSHIYDEPDSAESELHVFITPIRETQTSSRSLWDAIEQSTQTIDESMGPDIRHAMGIRAVLALSRGPIPQTVTCRLSCFRPFSQQREMGRSQRSMRKRH
jgi:hypothetical protein